MKAQPRVRFALFAKLLAPFAVFLSLIPTGCHEILSPDISGKSITVNSPADSLYTADEVISFWWEQDEDVERFEMRITVGAGGNLSLLVDTLMSGNTVAWHFPDDGLYDWQLRGKNEGSETSWVKRSFIVDRTAPDKATASGMNGDTLPAGVTDTLRWQSVDLPVDGLQFGTADSLVIFRKNDSVTVGARYYFAEGEPKEMPVDASSPSPLNGAGMYYWQVVGFDRAGNRKVSDLFRFVVQ